jgi:hypothetical protein
VRIAWFSETEAIAREISVPRLWKGMIFWSAQSPGRFETALARPGLANSALQLTRLPGRASSVRRSELLQPLENYDLKAYVYVLIPRAGWNNIMLSYLKCRGALIAVVFIGVGPMMGSALSLTAEIAKKCDALTMKAFPLRVAGNPAAGSAKGTGQSEQRYFKKCVENGGKMGDRGRAN